MRIFNFRIGNNGAGKTTTVRMLATILDPTDGKASVYGHDIVKDRVEIRKIIGVVTEESGVTQPDWTPLEYVGFFGASTFTNFKEDWRGNMFDYLLSMPISPTSYILSCGLSAAFLTSVFVMPVALLLAHCMQTFFGISLTIVDVALVVCIPPVLSFIISLSSATYLIFSLKTQYAYGIAYAILLFTVLITSVFPDSWKHRYPLD